MRIYDTICSAKTRKRTPGSNVLAPRTFLFEGFMLLVNRSPILVRKYFVFKYGRISQYPNEHFMHLSKASLFPFLKTPTFEMLK